MSDHIENAVLLSVKSEEQQEETSKPLHLGQTFSRVSSCSCQSRVSDIREAEHRHPSTGTARGMPIDAFH